MKKQYLTSYFTILIILFIAMFAFAETNVIFSWLPNPESDLFEYRLYQSDSSNNYFSDINKTIYDQSKIIAKIPKENTKTEILTIPDGNWFWVLTAVDNSGNESLPSNEISKTFDTTSPINPKEFKLKIEGVLTIRLN